jgi:hypothetical protein
LENRALNSFVYEEQAIAPSCKSIPQLCILQSSMILQCSGSR